jgi:hypothetical protein
MLGGVQLLFLIMKEKDKMGRRKMGKTFLRKENEEKIYCGWVTWVWLTKHTHTKKEIIPVPNSLT